MPSSRLKILTWSVAAFALGALVTNTKVADACHIGDAHSFLTSLVTPADWRGDANAIGKFNSNQANKGLVLVVGKVTAVSSSEISVRRSNTGGTTTDFTFAIDTSTSIIRKFKSTTSVSEIAVGDTVQVWATATSGGTAKLIWDKNIWRAGLLGSVSNLDSVNKTFKLTMTRIDKDTGENLSFTIMVKTTSSTTYWIGTTPKAFSDLTNGQNVYVRGTWDAAIKTLWAKNVGIIPAS